MATMKAWFIFATVFTVIGYYSSDAVELQTLRCYECNVWKAGYGHLCDNPRIVEGCTHCMKIETTIFMGYYKDTPRSSTMITRICGNDYTPHFGNECLHYKMVDGFSRRCFCESELCNAASVPSRGVYGPVVLLSTLYALYRRVAE